MEQNRQTATEQSAVIVSKVEAPQNDVTEIDLVELFFTLLRNWKLLLLAFIMGVVILAGYHGMFVKPTYRASTELYITNTDSVISLQDLQLGSALTEDYKTIITSRAVLNKVIDDLQLNTNFKGLRKLISVSNPTGTHIIRTSVTTNNMDVSRNIAKDLLNVSIDRIFQVIGTSEPTIIDYSEAEAVENVTPSLVRYMLIGGMVGLMLAVAVIILRVLMDNTIKNDDDVEKYLHLPVLSAVPYYDEQ